MEKYKSGAGIAAGCLMLKWNMMDVFIHRYEKIQPGSNVNLFINFETILRNLSMKNDISQMISFHKQDVVLELESAILNLIANYRSYFNKEQCNTKVFLYYTDLNFKSQMMSEFNKYYRDYYHNKYCQNQKFKMIGNLFAEIIVPEIKAILTYIPNCYFIESSVFDSSVIPMIIANNDRLSTNVIVSSDVFDTLYLFEPNFLTLYIKRRFSNFKIISDPEAAVQSIITDGDMFQMSTFNEEMYFKLLLSIKGSRVRNIQSAKGFGYLKFLKIINEALSSGKILKEFKSIDSIIDIFPDKYKDDIKLAYKCTDIRFQYSLLTDAHKEEILNQIIDLVDTASIENLNTTRFFNYPINTIGLLQQ